jgi:hypothetical protein
VVSCVWSWVTGSLSTAINCVTSVCQSKPEARPEMARLVLELVVLLVVDIIRRRGG